jgi:hypothetical protein
LASKARKKKSAKSSCCEKSTEILNSPRDNGRTYLRDASCPSHPGCHSGCEWADQRPVCSSDVTRSWSKCLTLCHRAVCYPAVNKQSTQPPLHSPQMSNLRFSFRKELSFRRLMFFGIKNHNQRQQSSFLQNKLYCLLF